MTEESLCPGCQHPELHKMCPAYGTPYYMSGEKLPDEIYNQRPLPHRANQLLTKEDINKMMTSIEQSKQFNKKHINEELANALEVASKVINCDNELSRHLLILTLLHLNKMSEGDKEKLLACWNEVLGIKPLKFDESFKEIGKKSV